MTLQTTATPINGKEARDTLERNFQRMLDETPGLDFATSYHRFTLKFRFELGAYPNDIPYPKREVEFDINSISTDRGENEEHFAYIKRIETVRAELIHRLEQVTSILDEVNPIIKIEGELQAGNEPDKLRIEQGMPIPVVSKSGGRYVEGYTNVVKKSNGFQFGGGNK